MPDDRFFHRRLNRSQKVGSLDDRTFRVWVTLVLEADDFGFVPRDPGRLRGQSLGLKRYSEAEIDVSMDHIVAVGLMLSYEVRDEQWLVDPRWGDFQKHRYFRETYAPTPPPEMLRKLSRNTLEMFRKHLRNFSPRRSRSRSRSRLSLSLAGVEPPLPGTSPVPPPSHANGAKALETVPASILAALDQAPLLGAVPRLRTPAFWSAAVRATGGRVEYAREILKAEAWLTANPSRSPKKDLARFVNSWLARAEEAP